MTLQSGWLVQPTCRWSRPAVEGRGFHWGQDPGGGALVPRPDIARREYDVFDEEGALFRNFAETEATPDGFLAFANRYGGLLIGGEGPRPAMERLSFWRSAHLWMAHVVSLWDAIQASDES